MGHGQTHGRKARALIEHAGHHLPQRQLPFAGWAQRLLYPYASRDVVHGPHRPKREPLLQRDGVLDGPQVFEVVLVAQRQPHRFYFSGGTMTDIGNRAVENLPIGAIRLAQQMPRIRFATTSDVRGIDIHSGYYYNLFMRYIIFMRYIQAISSI